MEAEKYLGSVFDKLRLLYQNDKTEIWLVMDRQEQKVYVMKKIGRVGLSYQALMNIHHQGLPAIRYACEIGNFTYVVEQYLQGQTLAQLIEEKGHLSEKMVRNIALELCRILRVLHGKQILHRDIKPSNIFLTEDRCIKLIDFDAARIKKENQQADTVYLGTEGFAAPEQYGSRPTDERSDIYSLGVTLRVLLGEDYEGEMTAVLAKCTEFDAKHRFQNVGELERALTLPDTATVSLVWPLRWRIYYQIYHARWFLFVMGVIWQGLALGDWAAWRTNAAILQHVGIMMFLCGIYFYWQHRRLLRWQHKTSEILVKKTVPFWKKTCWAAGYFILWQFTSIALVGGLGISYSQPWEKFICFMAMVVPVFFVYATLQWRLLEA